jgi:hypothetical protein
MSFLGSAQVNYGIWSLVFNVVMRLEEIASAYAGPNDLQIGQE